MRRLGIALVLVLAATTAFAHDHNRGWNISNGDNCTARNFHFDDDPAFVVKETIDGGSARSLEAAVTHSPLAVIGDSSAGYTIDVCKAARYAEDLDRIHVTFRDGVLDATGPDHRGWTVIYHIHAPRGAELNLQAQNGPLSIRNVDGHVVAHTENGPLSLSNVTGSVDASTTNGPISVHGGSGSMKVRATNGPLSVSLDGTSWSGGLLDAATKNGPLSLQIPRGYGSGVTVRSNGRGPISCRADDCRRQTRSWADDDSDSPRVIHLGNGAESVKLSATNGPITIRDDE